MKQALNFNWQFVSDYKDEYLNTFPNSRETINIPHCAKEVPYNYFDEKDYQFISTYQKDFDVEEAKKASPRKLELRVLKQRYGRTGEKFHFLFHTRYNYFEQDDQFIKIRDGQKTPFDRSMEEESNQEMLIF